MIAGSLFHRVVADKIDDQRVFGSKDGIRIEVPVPFDKQMRRDRRKTVRRNEQVDMSRSERMSAQRS